jgi:hypothetical protein
MNCPQPVRTAELYLPDEMVVANRRLRPARRAEVLKRYKPNDDDGDAEMAPPPRPNGKGRATVEDSNEDEDGEDRYDFARECSGCAWSKLHPGSRVLTGVRERPFGRSRRRRRLLCRRGRRGPHVWRRAERGSEDDPGHVRLAPADDDCGPLLTFVLPWPDRFEAAGDEDAEPSEVTLPTLRKMLVQFERVVKKNQEMRVKFPDDPEKCVSRSVACASAAAPSLLTTADCPGSSTRSRRWTRPCIS